LKNGSFDFNDLVVYLEPNATSAHVINIAGISLKKRNQDVVYKKKKIYLILR